MMRYLQNEKGIGLVELLMALALVGMVMAALAAVYLFASKSYDRQINMAEVQSEVRLSKMQISDDIGESIELEVSEDGHKLELADSKGDVKVTYELKDDQIYRNDNPITDEALKMDLMFTDLGNNLVQIDILDIDADGETVYELMTQCKTAGHD